MVMCMRVKFFAVLLCLLLLSGCSKTIDSPADELRAFSWQGDYENGNTVTLSFDDSNASLSVSNNDFELELEGLCVFSDDSFTICDNGSDINYTFGYALYGDRVEMSFIDGTISLKKL